jgi:hypothetical protein
MQKGKNKQSTRTNKHRAHPHPHRTGQTTVQPTPGRGLRTNLNLGGQWGPARGEVSVSPGPSDSDGVRMSGTQSIKPVQMPRAGLPHRMGRRTGVSASCAHQAVTVQ